MSLFSRGGKPSAAPPKPGPDAAPRDAIVHDGSGQGAPAEALKRIEITERLVRKHEPRWRELWSFFDGDQFAYISAVDGQLTTLETREGGDKPAHRPRLTRNRFTRAIVNEVSVLTSRFPSYECTPTSPDPEKINAARTGEKGLIHLHEKLGLRRKVFQVGLNAAVTGDGFAWPFWDGSVGAPVVFEPTAAERMSGAPDQIDTGLRQGAIAVRALRQEQVGWEPGVEFENSRWYVVRLTESCDDVTASAGYEGPAQLVADARPFNLSPRDASTDRNLCFVYHYLERPSAKFPAGRWIQVANGKLIRKVADYPCSEDIPVLHHLPWIERGQRRDRSLGLGELAIDIQRSINRIINQMIVWRNLMLNPQWVAPENSIVDPMFTDEPGLLIEYRGPQAPEPRRIEEIPESLFRELEQAYADLEHIVGGGAPVLPNIESGSGIAAANEREQSYRSMLLGNLASFYNSLGKHLIYLMGEHWTESQLIEVTGRFGVETVRDFVGEALKGSIGGVRVREASIEPRTREVQEAKIMAFADKGWVSPERAMQALNSGTADAVIDDFELDIARVNRQIQGLILLGSDPELQAIADPAALIPSAMPQIDNHAVFIDRIAQWMKTVDFERQPPLVQEAAMNWFGEHQLALQQQQMLEASMVQARADSQGMANAGKPQGAPAEGSRPSVANEAAAMRGEPTK